MRLLLAEDEPELNAALCAILKHASYTVDAVDNGRDACDYALSESYDGLILDVMMPGMDGVEVLRRLREQGVTTPALFLTAKSALDDKILGLDAGADDYLTKPFETAELLARIRAMTRRKDDAYTPDIQTFGNLSLDRVSHKLRGEGEKEVTLVGNEFQILEMLLSPPGRIVSASLFLEHIWGDADVEDNIVFVCISNLRKKLNSLNADVEIKSARGLGYSLKRKED